MAEFVEVILLCAGTMNKPRSYRPKVNLVLATDSSLLFMKQSLEFLLTIGCTKLALQYKSMTRQMLRGILQRAGLRHRQAEPREEEVQEQFQEKTQEQSHERLQAEPEEQPPSYSDSAVFTFDRQTSQRERHEYGRRAQEILRACRDGHSRWDCEEESPVIGDCLEAYIRKEGPEIRNEVYICAVLDQYEQEAEYSDFLVDSVGLAHANGVENCASWNWRVTTEDPLRCYDDGFLESVAEDGDRIALSVARATSAFEQGKIIPSLSRRYYYVAACVYESRQSQAHGERLIHMLNVLDKQCYLLRHRRGWLNNESLLAPKARAMDGPNRFCALLAEAERANYDFGDLLGMRCFMAAKFGLSEAFLDEVFVKTPLQRAYNYKPAPKHHLQLFKMRKRADSYPYHREEL